MSEGVAGVLEGVRVVEIAQGVAAPFSTKLLADLGADVVKFEPPGGDYLRGIPPLLDGLAEHSSAVFFYVNTSKRIVACDLSSENLRERALGLVRRADLLVVDRSAKDLRDEGIDVDALMREHPSLVVLSLTPYGESGPSAGAPATPFTIFHAGGEGYLTPVASHLAPDLATRPPLRQGRFGGEFKLAPYAATLAMAAVFHAHRCGEGQYIECAKQDLLIGLNFLEFQGYLSDGEVPTRSTLATPFGGIMACADGYLQLTFHEEHQWRALVAMMGEPPWASEEWAKSAQSRSANAARVNERLSEWLAHATRDEVVRKGQAMGVTVAPYLSVEEVAASEQLESRGFFSPVRVGRHEVRVPVGPWRFNGEAPVPRAPRMLESSALSAEPWDDRKRPVRDACASPLAGVRVLDFTWAVAGPTATMILAALGAQVIKVESASRPDVLRRAPWAGATTNRQKSGITLDLRHDEARGLVDELVAKVDVVAESFRPGVMEELGLDYERLAAKRPDLVMLSSSMAGQRGPQSRFAGYAPMFVALSGLGDLTGYPDGPPTQIRVGGDVIVGVYAGFAVMAALLRRQASGEGAHIDLSAIEAQASLVGDALVDYAFTGRRATRRANADEAFAPHDCYRCGGEDDWVAVAVEDDATWRSLVALIGDSALGAPRLAHASGRIATRSVIDASIGQWCATMSSAEAADRLRASGIPASSAYRADQLFDDPHVRARDLVARVPGEGATWPLVRLGGRLSRTPLVLTKAGPALGEHTDAVLAELLGYERSKIDDLRARGVLS